jgi:plasmid stabilization system protein ParE
MSEFVLHPEAFADLREIWDFISADNATAADRTLNEIHEAIRMLVKSPHAGYVRPELTSKAVRFHPVRDYLIAYAADEKPAIILAMLAQPAKPSHHRRTSARAGGN